MYLLNETLICYLFKGALFSDDLIQKLGYLNEDVSSAKLTLKHFKSLKDTLEEMRVGKQYH